MPVNPHYHAEINPNGIYHLCNRTNNRELLFLNDENRRFFLQQFRSFTEHLLEPLGWSLLPNHFHFQVKAKPYDYVWDFLNNLCRRRKTKTHIRFLAGEVSFNKLASRELTRFFQSYSLSLNNSIRRNGNLFYKRFRCVDITDEEQFRKTLVYIHTNPVKHGIVQDFTKYEWSSWNEYMSKKHTWINKEEVYRIFGNKQAFLKAHEVHQQFLLEKWKYDL